jgi:FkbM family methyltransferase
MIALTMDGIMKEPGGGNSRNLGSHFRNSLYLERFSYEALIRPFLGNKPLILFDIGARFGESTNWFLNNFEIGHAELFEPNPFVEIDVMPVQNLTKNIHRFGLSDVCGTRNLYIHQDAGMTSYESLNDSSHDSISYKQKASVHIEPVGTRRLDCLELGKPDIVKIDVQSHEESVLLGGLKTLKEARVILIEVNLYDLYSRNTTIGRVEKLLPNHIVYSIPHLSQNPFNLRTDWVELFFIRKDLGHVDFSKSDWT